MVLSICAGILARVLIYSLDLSARPELNSVTNSFGRLTETRYSQNQSVLARALFGICEYDTTLWFVLLCALDFISARLIATIGRHYVIKEKFNFEMIVSLAWLNPLSIIACGGLSAGVISNSLILSCWLCALERHSTLSALFLVLSSIDRFYPIQLILPIALLFKVPKLVASVGIWSGLIAGAVSLLGGVPSDLVSNWRIILNLSDYEPGLNYSWYMLIELFDHFRQFFILIIQVSRYQLQTFTNIF